MPYSQHLRPAPLAEASAQAAAGRSERRRTPRDNVHEPSRGRLVALVLGTYAEMQGLTLHLHQAVRLFGLRQVTCQAVLGELVRDGRLRQSPDGQYRAANTGGW